MQDRKTEVKSCLNCVNGGEFFPGNPKFAECDFDPGEVIYNPEKCARECKNYEKESQTFKKMCARCQEKEWDMLTRHFTGKEK